MCSDGGLALLPPECRGWGHVWFGWTGDLSRLRRLSLLLGDRSVAAVLLLSSVAPCLALKEQPLTRREVDDACRRLSADGRGCAGLAGHGAGPVCGFASVCLSLSRLLVVPLRSVSLSLRSMSLSRLSRLLFPRLAMLVRPCLVLGVPDGALLPSGCPLSCGVVAERLQRAREW